MPLYNSGIFPGLNKLLLNGVKISFIPGNLLAITCTPHAIASKRETGHPSILPSFNVGKIKRKITSHFF